jgi:hypothetical protein
MKIKIKIISSYRPTEETKRRFDRLASLILENTGKESIVDRKDDRLNKTVSRDIFS